jgi:hypothetical protein
MNNTKLFGISLIIYQIFAFIISPITPIYFLIKLMVVNLDPILIIAGLLIGCFLINEKRESLILPVVIAVAISLIVMPLIDSYKREKVSGFFLRVDAVLIWSYLGYIFKEIYKKRKNKTINRNKK